MGDVITAWGETPVERTRDVMRLLGPDMPPWWESEAKAGLLAWCSADDNRKRMFSSSSTTRTRGTLGETVTRP